MALAMLARALSLRRANQRAKGLRHSGRESIFPEFGIETSPEQSVIHSSRVSQSIDALYVLSCLRDGVSLTDAFASDEVGCSRHALVSCRPSDAEKLTLSSQSLSERARSSDAWDRFSFSLSSSGRESIESLSKDAVRSCNTCAASLSNEKRGDFCLDFNTGQLISSPSPPAALASDCCGCWMSRKSNHFEKDFQGLANQNAERDRVTEPPQRKDKLRQSTNGCAEDGLLTGRSIKLQEGGTWDREEREDELNEDELQKGANVAVPTSGKANGAEREEETSIGELHRLLREDAMAEVVAKQSGNPYLDFRESMLQMMTASFVWDGRQRKVELAAAVEGKYIEDLLYCYLRLNSRELHGIITQAFSDTFSLLFATQI